MASALHAVIGAVVLRLLTEGLGLLALLIPLLRWIITLVAGGVFVGIFFPKDGAAYEVGLQLLRNQSDTLTAVIPLGWVLREWHVYPETTSALNASSGRLGLFLLGLLPAVLLFRLAVIRQYSNRFKRNSLALVGDQIGEAAAEVTTQPQTPANPAEFAGSGTLRSRVEDLVTQEASRWSENTAPPPLLPSGSSLLDRWLLRLATPGQRSLWALVRPRAEAFRVSYLLIVLVLAFGALLLGVFRPWIEHWMRFLMGVPPVLSLVLAIPWSWHRGYDAFGIDQSFTSMAECIPVRSRDLVALHLKHSLIMSLLLAVPLLAYECLLGRLILPIFRWDQSVMSGLKWLALLPVATTFRAISVRWGNIQISRCPRWLLWMFGVPVFGLMSGFALLVLFSLLETGRDGLLFAMPTEHGWVTLPRKADIVLG